MKLRGIYLILNLLNGKFYIGQANDIKQRWRQHRSYLNRNIHQNLFLQNSWIKNGENNFEFHIIEYCSIDKLDEREQWWLDITHCWDRKIGYNLRPMAESNRGVRRSKEAIAKTVASRSWYRHSEETKRKLSLAKIGNKNAYGLKSVKRDMALVEKLNALNRGSKRTEEVKRKMSLAQTGRKTTDKTKLKISLARKGNKYRRKADKWPHELGCRCTCNECMRKKSQNLQERRKNKNYQYLHKPVLHNNVVSA